MTISKIAIDKPETRQTSEIMSEMQQAADQFSEIGHGVSIFGSARIHADSPYYKVAYELGTRLAKAGIPVIAGGGPGIMEAANHGAFDAGGKSVGLNISLPRENGDNAYQTHSLHFNHFSTRKNTFFSNSLAFVVMPGGFGTLDEFSEVVTLIQTRKMQRVPVILVGTRFWSGLMDWIRAEPLANKLISPHDFSMITLTDDVDLIMREIQASCGHLGDAAQNADSPAPMTSAY
jgi:uncharacterized protein (TIGR00730 family)